MKVKRHDVVFVIVGFFLPVDVRSWQYLANIIIFDCGLWLKVVILPKNQEYLESENEPPK